ncbi:ribonuclease P protein component [Gordonia sp. CPCC 206044]|uniref:ribonuclease P protein component n=1 Tax=Gordonia sp. CPCC 206044 TaxID=3140793 RepID=UPI003AF3F1A2
MVAPAHRISRGSDFTRTLRSGVRVNTRDLVIHFLPVPVTPVGEADGLRTADLASAGGPRLGLIVSKSVGNAVIRHRTARRLRAAFEQCLPHFPTTQLLVVIRARPQAAMSSSTALAEQLSGALTHRRLVAAIEPADRRVAP